MLRATMKRKQGGFTLVELMFTIVVLAVLLSLGIPNFRDFLRNSRMTSAANDLLGDIHTARTEAIKRRVVVGVCASPDPLDANPACAAPGATSFRGWVVFVDDSDPNAVLGTDGNGVIDAGETVLRRHALFDGTARSDAGFISFGEAGFARTVGGAQSASRIVLCDARGNAVASGGRSAARAVTISRTGRAGVTRTVADITALGGC
jgi:type IV fimbrial biogenesis protein FimT